jgi:anaerobic magnesium-protoporphyrin IX monomethyl ester cyclase
MIAATRPIVLLINPRMCTPRHVRLPLSLLTLAAEIEGRYSYRILDGNAGDFTADLHRALRDAPAAVAAVTVMPGPQVAPAIEVSRAIRALRPDVPIVWGGYFPTLYPDAARRGRARAGRGDARRTHLPLARCFRHQWPDLAPRRRRCSQP